MIYIGTILEIDNNKTYVFTADCAMTAIRTKKDFFVGKQIAFSKKDKHSNIIANKNNIIKSCLAFVAVFAIIVSTLMVSSLFDSKKKFDNNSIAVVSVDINPSIEINVNKDERIVSTIAKNDDGKKVLEGLELKELPLKEGVEKIVSVSKQLGYIEDGKKIVFVTAALNSKLNDSSDNYTTQLKNILSSLEKEQSSENILTVFIEDSDIIASASDNDLSIGREFLYKYAKLQNGEITAEEIRQGKLVDLLQKLNALEQDGKLGNDIKKEANGDIDSSQDINFNPEIKVTAISDGLSINWSKAPSSEGFNYYKIVASKSNSSPAYPLDGYAVAISNIENTSNVINSNSAYHDGDVGGKLLEGESYYFSVTYVYNGKTIKANAIKATMPKISPAATTTTPTTTVPTTTKTPTKNTTTTPQPQPTDFSPKMSMAASGNILKFSWTPTSNTVSRNGKKYAGFHYYKVVASETDSTPTYPENGWVKYITDNNVSNWSVDASNYSFESTKLVPGKTYYFSITYVFDNGYIYSNVIKTKVPGTVPVNNKIGAGPELTSAAAEGECAFRLKMSASDGNLNFSWDKIPEGESFENNGVTYSNFYYYKVVVSKTNPNPKYSIDPYLTYICEKNNSSWSVNPLDTNSYSGIDLIPGQQYYFSITYCFENGKIYIPGLAYTIPNIS